MNATAPNHARAATLAVLRETLLPAYLNPVPTEETLRAMFDDAKIPRFKSNPSAKRGGGPVYYSVAAVEKLLKSRMLPGRMAA